MSQLYYPPSFNIFYSLFKIYSDEIQVCCLIIILSNHLCCPYPYRTTITKIILINIVLLFPGTILKSVCSLGIQDDRGLSGNWWQVGIESGASLGRDAHALTWTREVRGVGTFKIQISCHNSYILVLFIGSTTRFI